MNTGCDEDVAALLRAVLKPQEEALLVVSPRVKPADSKAKRRAVYGAVLLVLLSGVALSVDTFRWVLSLMLLPLWVLALAWLSAPHRARLRMGRTLCLLTTQRALVLQPKDLGYRCVAWPLYVGLVTAVESAEDGTGSIMFDRCMHRHYPDSVQRTLPSGFESVPQVERVQQLITEQLAMASREHETETERLFSQRGTVTALDADGQFLNDVADSPKEYSASPGIVLGSCFSLLACVFLWGLLPKLWMDMRLDAAGVPATGTVLRVDSVKASTGGENKASYFPVIRFATADGTERVFRSTCGCGATEYPPGCKVELCYLPTDPTQVRLVDDRGYSVLLLLFSTGFFWFGLALAGRGVIKYWKRKYHHESF